MKKLTALVLSVGMVLLGTAPVLAAGSALPSPAISKDLGSGLEEITILEPPNMGMLGDEELKEVDGEGLVGAVAGAVGGFIGGAIGGAITAAVYTYAQDGSVNWTAVGAGMLGGAIGTAIEGAIAGAIAGP